MTAGPAAERLARTAHAGRVALASARRLGELGDAAYARGEIAVADALWADSWRWFALGTDLDALERWINTDRLPWADDTGAP